MLVMVIDPVATVINTPCRGECVSLCYPHAPGGSSDTQSSVVETEP